MSEPLPSPDSAGSWRQVRVALEKGRGGMDASAGRGMALMLLTELERKELVGMFRMARAGERLVLLAVEPGQEEDAPRVSLTFLPEDGSVKVAYGRGDAEAKAPLIEAWVSAAVAGQVTAGGLRRLWTETRPGVPMPEALLRA